MPRSLTIPESSIFLLTAYPFYVLQYVTLGALTQVITCNSSHFRFAGANVFLSVPV